MKIPEDQDRVAPELNVPDLIPARVLAKHRYCPRLFHLEWVQQQFRSNSDVDEGRWLHRRVDRPRGSLPSPGTEWHGEAASVDLSSERIGITARLDVVRGEGWTVVPVETKKGRSPRAGYGPWPSDLIQVAAHMALLRGAGYRCEKGELFYVEDRQVVTVEWSPDLEEELKEAIESARLTASDPTPPPPLVDDSRCPRCALVTLCLPDEVNLVSRRSEGSPRRLVTRDPDSRPLYVTENGTYVGVTKGRLRLRREGHTIEEIRLIDVSHLALYGNIQISSQAIGRLLSQGKLITWFSHGGWFRGIALGLPGKNVELRIRQTRLANGGNLELARSFVSGKIRTCRTLVMRNAKARPHREIEILKEAVSSAESATGLDSLLGIEGAAARTYWGAFPTMLKEASLPGAEFTFSGRNRRPPRDAVNCLLSYVYGLLVKDLTVTTLAVGFDPYLGFYHRPRFGRPALALDLAEEFRPLIGDSVVLGLINNGEVKPGHFIVRGEAVGLTKEGRRVVLGAYERRLDTKVKHPVYGYRVSYRRVLDVQVRMLAAFVMGEVVEYLPMVTR